MLETDRIEVRAVLINARAGCDAGQHEQNVAVWGVIS